MRYKIKFSPQSQNDISKVRKDSEAKRLLRKIDALLEELKDHPRTGTGKPEQQKGYGERDVWARHITDKHRLVYEIKEDV